MKGRPTGRPRVDPELRFWNMVDAEGDCWQWTGAIDSGGYGHFSSGGTGGRTLMPHRYVWELLVGPIGDGLQIDHLCRNRACVNPDHLEPVTPQVNSNRGFSPKLIIHRSAECSNGHPFTAKTTYFVREQRRCRICNRISVDRYQAKKAAR